MTAWISKPPRVEHAKCVVLRSSVGGGAEIGNVLRCPDAHQHFKIAAAKEPMLVQCIHGLESDKILIDDMLTLRPKLLSTKVVAHPRNSWLACKLHSADQSWVGPPVLAFARIWNNSTRSRQHLCGASATLDHFLTADEAVSLFA